MTALTRFFGILSLIASGWLIVGLVHLDKEKARNEAKDNPMMVIDSEGEVWKKVTIDGRLYLYRTMGIRTIYVPYSSIENEQESK
jgi:hypothetical protein